eukprot:5028579-Pyramimonas_sp.AAC.1
MSSATTVRLTSLEPPSISIASAHCREEVLERWLRYRARLIPSSGKGASRIGMPHHLPCRPSQRNRPR